MNLRCRVEFSRDLDRKEWIDRGIMAIADQLDGVPDWRRIISSIIAKEQTEFSGQVLNGAYIELKRRGNV